MSTRDLSLKELRALALERLGARGAELKTRQELIDALEAKERKKAPRKLVALAEPLPAPVEPPAPVALPPAPHLWMGELPMPKITAGPVAELSEPTPITRDFFLDPDVPRLPTSYEDDRVLTFARDPSTLFAAWDLVPGRFTPGVHGRVVDAAGDPLASFDLSGPVGGVFLEALPSGVALKVELISGEAVLGQSGWVTMPRPPRAPDQPAAPSSDVG